MIRELQMPVDEALYRQVWEWMREQPETYSGEPCFNDFAAFTTPVKTVRDFGLFEGDALLGMVTLIYHGNGETEVGLISPPRPRVRKIIPMLWQMVSQFYEQNVGIRLFANVGKMGARLMRFMGWTQVAANQYQFTILDYLYGK